VLSWGDSLAAVGGELSIDAIGDLNPIPWMLFDNSFKVTTDTMAGNDTIRTHKILIDSDPSNADFSDSLHSDIIRAIAWIEYAGSNDTTHCHHPYNSRWNNYWDDVISGHDTCSEIKLPCENTISTASGTMQMLRSVWEDAFNGINHRPLGYYRCSWDTLEWNWKINIFNGKYIIFRDYPSRLTGAQKKWDSVCTQCSESDSIPRYPNREDLVTYGYRLGSGNMRNVTADNWKTTVQIDTIYVQPVRSAKHRRPWR
jgi:hypothetical protein